MTESQNTVIDNVLQDIPKIDLLVVVPPNSDFEVVKDNRYVKPENLVEIAKSLPPSANECCISIDKKGVAYFRQLENKEWLIAVSRYQIMGAINALLVAPAREDNTEATPEVAALPSSQAKPSSTEDESHGDAHSVLRIQKRFLKKNSVTKYFKNSILKSEPQSEVGGDFFWIRQINEKSYLALADCHVNGSMGALLAMHLDALFDQQVFETPFDFDVFLSRINTNLNAYNLDYLNEEDISKKISISIALVVYDSITKEVVIFNEGVGVRVVGNQEIVYSKNCKDGKNSKTIQLPDSGKLVLFTDGFEKNREYAIFSNIEKQTEKSVTTWNIPTIKKENRLDDATIVALDL